MRIVLVIAIWIIMIGGMFLFMNSKESAPSIYDYKYEEVKEAYSLEIVATSPAEPDPFTLQTDESSPMASILVKINGIKALRITEPIDAGEKLTVENVPGLKIGENEFYVEVNPPIESVNKIFAVRVSVNRGYTKIASETLWSPEGLKVADTFTLYIKEDESSEDHSHE